MAAYSDAVRARCRDLRRAGGWPEGTSGTGTGAAGSLDGGALTRLQVHVAETTGVVDDARYRVFGCSAAVASASFVADALVGCAPAVARTIDAETVAAALGLPADKQAMAALATGAARAAIDDWESRAGSRGSGPGDQGAGLVGQRSDEGAPRGGAASEMAAHSSAAQVRT